ncbi:MAG: AAA family ATPase [Alphaproteobacteria bacterium]|nr:AAA family ATPase [Alphaproteobacteria bacterium]
MAQIIALFNHKGGVSKTTTVFNLGWMMANLGKRVLLVDTDPQCNLTGVILGMKQLDELSTLSTDGVAKNIQDGLRPAFDSQPKPIEAVECMAVNREETLFLMPGSIRLAEYEVTLGIAQELSGSLSALRNIPGSIRHLIDLTAAAYDAEYVLIDMSPSLGALNQNVLTISDYFIVPLHPDYFSTMGIDSLAATLPRWKRWADSASSHPVLAEAAYPFVYTAPAYLGSVVQKYRPRAGNRPASAFQQWIDELQAAVDQKLIPALQKAGMVLSNEVYKGCRADVTSPLVQMSDFNSLIAKSQANQVPIFELTVDQLGTRGNVLEAELESQTRFRELFTELANKVICLTENDDRL